MNKKTIKPNKSAWQRIRTLAARGGVAVLLLAALLAAVTACSIRDGLDIDDDHTIYEVNSGDIWPGGPGKSKPKGPFTVTFDKNGGDTDASPAAQTVTPPATRISGLPAADPAWAARAFEGWWTKNGFGGDWGVQFTDATPVTSDITVYARWNPPPNYYLVTFDKNGGNTEADPASSGIAEGSTVNPLPAPPGRSNHIFIGWNTADDGTGVTFDATIPVTADITVYAQWTPAFTVLFDKNNGDTDADPLTKTVIPPVTTIDALPVPPARSGGYAFTGWNTADDGSGVTFDATISVTADITVYAQWAPAYTVRFDKNNGDTDASPAFKTVIPPVTLIDSLPTPPARSGGYVFIGWNTAANGSGTAFTAATPVTADITVYAQWTLAYFKFTIRTTGANENFAIPTSGQLNRASAKPYAWIIDWGDGQSGPASGTSSDSSVGIQHTYSIADDYQITISPDLSTGSIDAWFGAFGFCYGVSTGANDQTNRDKLISLDSPLTLLMTRTQAQISAGSVSWDGEWKDTFSNCQNPAFTMGADFKFAAEWDAITTVMGNFAEFMFASCSGAAFTMSDGFNLPAGITTVSNSFARSMFDGCRGDAFTMSGGFNLPTGITSVIASFANGMFNGCSGAAFTMNDVFNLPAGITSVHEYFAAMMFYGCSGSSFQVNDVFKFPVLSSQYKFAMALNLGAGAAVQSRKAATIINGNGPPSTYSGSTFSPATAWSDYSSIHAKWR